MSSKNEGDPGSGAPSFPLFFYLLTPLLAVLACGLLFEAFFAFFAPVPFQSEHNMYYIADPHTGFRLQPNSTGHFRDGLRAEVNEHGHRDDSYPLEKPAGKTRILVLGDSFTQGSNVAQDETYAQVLEALLAEQGRGDVEVLNTGVGGWHPYQYAEYLEHYGLAFEPDLVLVGFFVGNDSISQAARLEDTRTAVAGVRMVRGKAVDPELTSFKVWLYDHSHLARLYFNRGRLALDRDTLVGSEGEPRNSGELPEKYLAIQSQRLSRNHRPDDRRMRRAMANSVAQVKRLARRAAEQGIPTVVLLIPDENQVNPTLARRALPPGESLESYDFSMPQKALRELFNEAGLKVIDPLEDFLEDPRRLYMNDTHWSPPGHRLAAEKLARELLPLLPPPPTPREPS